jgi:hypothetical protein
MRLHAPVVVALSLLACTPGLHRDWFVTDDHRYHVAPPDPNEWRQVHFDSNDLAWVNEHGNVLATNSTCRNFEDAPLDVLTNHLLMGFTDRVQVDKKTYMMDGREALQTAWTARMDGVPVDINVTVLKKDGCIYDFTLIAPLAHGADHLATFDRLLDGFTTSPEGPPPRTRSATVRAGSPEVRPDDTGPEAKVQ